jgi:hypothetical protein
MLLIGDAILYDFFSSLESGADMNRRMMRLFGGNHYRQIGMKRLTEDIPSIKSFGCMDTVARATNGLDRRSLKVIQSNSAEVTVP